MDNATSHGIQDPVNEELQKKQIGITRTPPLGCLLNPIEELCLM